MKKYNLLIPIAGLGKRFLEKGYSLPKPLILIDNKSIIEWTMSCIDYSECNVIFVVRKNHVIDFNIDGYLRNRFGEDIKIIEAEKLTEGSVCSCLLAEELIDNKTPLIIHSSDIFFEPIFIPKKIEEDGMILTFKSNSTNYSYVNIDENNLVNKTAEKQVISQNACVGIYCYKEGREFVRLGKEMINRNIRTNGEFFITPLYNLFIGEGKKITTKSVDKMNVFGTPEELDFFVNNSLQTFSHKKNNVALCSDHSGFETKEIFKKILKNNNISFVDFGVYDKNSDRDYCEYVNAATNAIIKKQCNFGFGFCRSGQGININANKIKGIRSGWVFDKYLAEYAIRHNCCNFFSIPEIYTNGGKLLDIFNAWKNNTFDGGRHQIRISKLEI